MRKHILRATVLVTGVVVAACGPRIRPLQPVMANGEILPPEGEQVVERAHEHGELALPRPDPAPEIERGPAATAARLLREGDEYTAAGRLDLALKRYDQADVLRPNHPETNLRIAQVLDKQLRPVEAVLRYRMFIHQMELERIRAHGEVAAGIAEAIARARERVVVLERR